MTKQREPQAGEAVGPRLDAPVVRLEPARANLRPPALTDYACCGNCRYWVSPRAWPADGADTKGCCHRKAPAPVFGELTGWAQQRYWPGTYISDWCGDHELLATWKPHNAGNQAGR